MGEVVSTGSVGVGSVGAEIVASVGDMDSLGAGAVGAGSEDSEESGDEGGVVVAGGDVVAVSVFPVGGGGVSAGGIEGTRGGVK